MKRRLGLGQLLVCSVMLMTLASCQKEEFYEKDSYETFSDIYERNQPNFEGPDLPSVSIDDESEDDDQVAGTDPQIDPGADDGENPPGNGGDDQDDGTVVDNDDDNDDQGGDDQQPEEPARIAKNENFVQNDEQSKKMDILWVVDNSGSMADEQAKLAYNFNVFIKDFLTKNVDFQMAIITTDVSSSSKAGKPVTNSMTELTSAKAHANKNKFLNNFANMIQVGTSGSSTEQGLQATNSFASKHGLSFFREDAYLIIVIVSDENDSSPKSVAEHMNYLMSYKSQKSLIKTYSIVDTSGAPKTGQWHAPGYDRYAKATEITGGTVSSIHGDFHSTLSQIGESVANLAKSFALNGTPIEGTIEVLVDGVNQTTGWSYDSASRSVSFAEGWVPAAGAQIEVKYQQYVQ